MDNILIILSVCLCVMLAFSFGMAAYVWHCIHRLKKLVPEYLAEEKRRPQKKWFRLDDDDDHFDFDLGD